MKVRKGAEELCCEGASRLCRVILPARALGFTVRVVSNERGIEQNGHDHDMLFVVEEIEHAYQRAFIVGIAANDLGVSKHLAHTVVNASLVENLDAYDFLVPDARGAIGYREVSRCKHSVDAITIAQCRRNKRASVTVV